MTTVEILENKIRNAIPELKEEWDVFQEGAIDADMITKIALNHAIEYIINYVSFLKVVSGHLEMFEQKICHDLIARWNLKSAYIKDQSPELITFLNELK